MPAYAKASVRQAGTGPYIFVDLLRVIRELNEMAKKHICMMKKGFKYNGEYGTYCHQYPNLPACVEARSATGRIINE
jgi:hypothetical protein